MQVPESNKKLVQRYGHSAAVLTISPQCIEVVLFGGKQSRSLLAPHIADTAVLRFGKISIKVFSRITECYCDYGIIMITNNLSLKSQLLHLMNSITHARKQAGFVISMCMCMWHVHLCVYWRSDLLKNVATSQKRKAQILEKLRRLTVALPSLQHLPYLITCHFSHTHCLLMAYRHSFSEIV